MIVANRPAVAAPTMTTEASVRPRLACSQTPAAIRRLEPIPASATRASIPIQPREIASARNRTIPVSIAAPPVQASTRPPKRSLSEWSLGRRADSGPAVSGPLLWLGAVLCGGLTDAGRRARPCPRPARWPEHGLERFETAVEIGQSFFHVRIVKFGCHRALLLTDG